MGYSYSMAACSSRAYRNGSWAHSSVSSYRLHRDVRANALVKGWAYAGRRFWGACDEGAPPLHVRAAVSKAWRPAECELREFSPAEVCDRLAGPSLREPYSLLFVGDSFTGQLFISFVALMGGAITSNTGAARTAPSGAIVFGDIAIAELRADAIACVDDAQKLATNWDVEPSAFQAAGRTAILPALPPPCCPSEVTAAFSSRSTLILTSLSTPPLTSTSAASACRGRLCAFSSDATSS